MLVLMVIFMITTQFVQHDVRSRMPLHAAAQPAEAARAQPSSLSILSLTIDAKGGLYLDGAVSNLAALKEKVRSLQADGKEAEAIITADPKVSHGTVVRVRDTLRPLGVVRFALNIQRQENE